MKGLRSPWISGALALIAVVVVIYQFAPLHLWSAAARPLVPAPVTPATPVAAPAGSAVAENPSAEPPDLPPVAVDRAQAEARFQNAENSPHRDPFRLLPSALELPVHRYPSPVLVWKLNAIWRQTDGRVAAIDNHIYAEGDKVHGYRIQAIEADRVIFQGPDGPEVLTFAKPAAGPARKQ